MGKKAACSSYLPSFPSTIYPFYIHTAGLIFHGQGHNMFVPNLVQKTYLWKCCNFWVYGPNN